MAERKKTASYQGVPIKVNVNLKESPTGEKPPKVSAYAFAGNGRFIAKAAVELASAAMHEGDGCAACTLPKRCRKTPGVKRTRQ